MKPIALAHGWALDIAVELDRHSMGFAGHFLRASDERRQVITAYFAGSSLDHADPADGGEASTHARFLLESDHRAILEVAYGHVPRGMRRALGRSGSQPHEREFYGRLHRLLTEPPHAGFRDALGHMTGINLTQICVLERLPEHCCSARLANIMQSVEYVERAIGVMNLLVARGVGREPLSAALVAVADRDQMRAFWQRWTLKATFPEHPVPPGTHYRPISTGAELRRMSLQLRNCSNRYIAAVIEGKAAFAETGEGKAQAVAHLRCLQGEWVLDSVYGPGNGLVDPSSEALIIEHLARWGVTERQVHSSSEVWEDLRRFTGGFNVWEGDDDA
jgi:hypothetical protein